MVTLTEITTSWNIPSGIPTKSYMYFDSGATLAAQRAALGAFWGAVDGSLSSQIFWSVDPTGRTIEEETGRLLGEWSETTVIAGSGGGSAQPVADATQANVQWNTLVVVNGRFLRGRTYVPGVAAAALTNGNLTEANRAAITSAGQALCDAAVGLRVWHRPVNSFGGVSHLAMTALCRSELAVLRKRRNRSS